MEIDGNLLLDIDRFRLFEAISTSGSIGMACQQLGILEREVRVQLQEMERLVPFQLFSEDKERATVLTDELQALLNRFTAMEEEIEDCLKNCSLQNPDFFRNR